MNRIDIVMEVLGVSKKDALTIIEHLDKQGCLDWIDDYDEESCYEQLTDIHCESNFKDMIDWVFEDCRPSEMLGRPTDIGDYPEMLQLTDKVIFWYSLV